LREKITRLHCSVESCRPITSFRTTSFRITPRTSRQLLAIALGSFRRSFRIAAIPCAYEIVPVCRAAPLRGSTPSANCHSDGVYEESIHACASRQSVLSTMASIIFARCACPNRGTIPASSISPTIQYQLPRVSTATGEPAFPRLRSARIAPLWCSTRALRDILTHDSTDSEDPAKTLVMPQPAVPMSLASDRLESGHAADYDRLLKETCGE
jgi:hypothetical protein